MSSEDMVEVVARAIYALAPVGVRGWEDAPADTAEYCRRAARAAIAAYESGRRILVIDHKTPSAEEIRRRFNEAVKRGERLGASHVHEPLSPTRSTEG